MAELLHFLASASQTICGDSRIGLRITRDQAKVLKGRKASFEETGPPGIPVDGACPACANALAVTTLVKPDAQIDPPVIPSVSPAVVEKVTPV